MNEPKVNFSFWPLSGKHPLEVSFINESENLGGYDEWSSCSINKKYHISHLKDISDIFLLDFSEWSEEGIIQTINENGFKIECIKPYYYDIKDNESPIKIKTNDDKYKILVDLTKDFHIEFTLVEFKNYYGSIQLYFEGLKPNTNSLPYDIGIHINTKNGERIVRDFNDFGEYNVANLKNYIFPVKIKFTKTGELLKLYINNDLVRSYSSNSYGVGKIGIEDCNLLCPLKFKIKTQNNVSNWCIHIKDVYIVNEGNYTNLVNYGLGFPAEYSWNFGDGDISTEKNPIHTYNSEGPKNITLNVTTENGVSNKVKNLIIFPDSKNLANADIIFKEKNDNIVRNLDSIPNYCSDIKLKSIINMAIHDACRYSDNVQDNVTVQLKLTLDKTEDNSRNMRCETNFIKLSENSNIVKEYVNRTLVETNKQGYLVDVNFNLNDPV
jgi:hypothetical protein